MLPAKKAASALLLLLAACGGGGGESGPPLDMKPLLIDDPYHLPQPLVAEDGTPITTPEAWMSLRRPETLSLFREHVFGKTPEAKLSLSFTVVDDEPEALGGTAVRRQVRIALASDPSAWGMDVLLYLPRGQVGRAPIFLGMNFGGNHTVNADPAIRLTESWIENKAEWSVTDNHASEAGRGARADRWPVSRIVERGYGLATVYYGDVDPDYDDPSNGIQPFFYAPGQTAPLPNEWGSIGAWAWGLSRALDYLVTDPGVDPARVAVMGHSRLGKTALWASAEDTRFALAIANNSGEIGAAIARRKQGETVEAITTVFPHWFAKNLAQYSKREEDMPVDMHQLVALTAPRPVYIASGVADAWADPRGEFEGGKYASVVYRLLGEDGLSADEWPAVDSPVLSRIGYHVRPGGHGVTPTDWERFMDFADEQLAP
jgi:hypothetical protein